MHLADLYASAPVAILGAAGLLYAAGVRAAWRRAGRGRAIRYGQTWCFAAGLSALALALASPLDRMSEELFAAHMVQHMLLAAVAPPFLVAGAPIVAALWAFPADWRRRVVRFALALPPITALWSRLCGPVFACTAHAMAMWTWHIPRFYELALRDPIVHVAEHMSFLTTAVMLWWGILRPQRARGSGYAIGMVTVFVTMVHTGALGALIALSGRPWYSSAARASAWGFPPLQDQQLAGFIMWAGGTMIYTIQLCVLFVLWMGAEARSMRSVESLGQPGLIP